MHLQILRLLLRGELIPLELIGAYLVLQLLLLSNSAFLFKAHIDSLTTLPSCSLHFFQPLLLFQHFVSLQVASEFVNFLLNAQLFGISSKHSFQLIIVKLSLKVSSLLFLHLSLLSPSTSRS